MSFSILLNDFIALGHYHYPSSWNGPIDGLRSRLLPCCNFASLRMSKSS